MTLDKPPLEGFSILVADDDPLIALDVSTMIEGADARVIRPCASVAAASTKVDEQYHSSITGSVLDFDPSEETQYRLAKNPSYATSYSISCQSSLRSGSGFESFQNSAGTKAVGVLYSDRRSCTRAENQNNMRRQTYAKFV